MARDQSKLTRTDGRVFVALQAGPLTARQAGAVLILSRATAIRSLHRLALHGLATAAAGERIGFATGSPPWIWTIVPGAVFPGPAPRKTYTMRHTKAAVAAGSIGLAGLVNAQMRGKGQS